MSSVIFIHYGLISMKKNKYFISIALILAPLLIGIASAILTKDMMQEYGALNKPPLSPPTILFPIAWTILYLLMGIASALIYSKEEYSDYRNVGLTLHMCQLILNFFWSIIFFNMKKYVFAFVWLVILWLVVFSMMANYKKISKTAFFLNVPYIVWLTFAGYLNLAVAIIN